jgi:hypothetical protein
MLKRRLSLLVVLCMPMVLVACANRQRGGPPRLDARPADIGPFGPMPHGFVPQFDAGLEPQATERAESEGAAQPAPKPPSSAATAVEQLREAAARLRSATFETHEAMAAALVSLPGALEALDCRGQVAQGKIEQTKAAAQQFVEAQALERLPPVVDTLGAALDALASCRAVEPDAWVATARAAVRAIDPENPFELQRTAVQDAYRTVIDALAVTVEHRDCTAQPD